MLRRRRPSKCSEPVQYRLAIGNPCAFDPLLSDDELLDFFGNQQADVAAGAALGRDVDWVRRQRDVAHARIQAVRDRFLSIFSGIGALHATKEDDPPSQPQEELAVSVCFSAPVDYLSLDIPEAQGFFLVMMVRGWGPCRMASASNSTRS